MSECYNCGAPIDGDNLCAWCAFVDIESSWPLPGYPVEEKVETP